MRLTPESRATIARFRRTVALAAGAGAAAWCTGLPAPDVMAMLCNGSAVVALLFGHALREEPTSPCFGRTDEATWLYLVGHTLRVAAHG